MKKIWLMGGLGNVLFQVLVSRVLKNSNLRFCYIDILTKKNFITKLLGWTIHERLFNDMIANKEIKEINGIKAVFLIFFALLSKKLHKPFNTVSFYSDSNQFNEPYSNNIFGYFQDKYFLEKNKKELLSLGNEIRNKYLMKESYIVVHYRWGDSNWAKEYSKYYNEVKNMIKNENERVLIATDSPREALSFFSDCNNIQITDSKSAMDDFKYLVNAKKLYCAPSTFSWWALHSLNNKSKAVVPSMFCSYLGLYSNIEIKIINN